MTSTAMARRLLIICPIVAALFVAGCGGSQVGGQDLFNGSNQTPGNFNFAAPSSSAAAAIGSQGAAPTPSERAAATQAVVTPRPTARPTATPAPVSFQIAIYGDSSAQTGFQPAAANVYPGTLIVFTNRDTQARSVVSDSGDPASFDSGMIAPGATWTYKTTVVGEYNYHDGTRPYTVASFKVVQR